MTRGRGATIAEPALLAEPPQNLSVAENEEQHLHMTLPEAQLEREKGRLQPGSRQEGIVREGGSTIGCLRRRRCPRVRIRRAQLSRQTRGVEED